MHPFNLEQTAVGTSRVPRGVGAYSGKAVGTEDECLLLN